MFIIKVIHSQLSKDNKSGHFISQYKICKHKLRIWLVKLPSHDHFMQSLSEEAFDWLNCHHMTTSCSLWGIWLVNCHHMTASCSLWGIWLVNCHHMTTSCSLWGIWLVNCHHMTTSCSLWGIWLVNCHHMTTSCSLWGIWLVNCHHMTTSCSIWKSAEADTEWGGSSSLCLHSPSFQFTNHH
jgi:coenzyme F420-reducing hydrogenase gamma subunit